MNSNTEYVPTKCRVTKPPPPKPAANPMQFVKVPPCPLFQKAQQKVKKVEEIKKERKEIREEAVDWQENLDNWKSSRRKRQEHIIERVVEVKKLEQEEHERFRRKPKTFNEMLGERSGRRHRFSIPIYEDDSNDLSDYGIGSSSSKTNSIKDVDTDDSSSVLDEKDQGSFESPKDNSSASNQSQSEDESHSKSNQSNLYSFVNPIEKQSKLPNDKTEEQYTYEGAIQGYRSRIKSKIDESIFSRNPDTSKSKDFSEAQTAIPKGEICKRKELFESVEIQNYDSPTSRRLSEDFVNSQSIKQRLQSLEKCTDQSLTHADKNQNKQSVETQLTNVNKGEPTEITNYLIENTDSCSSIETKDKERCSSPETELYMDNLKTFSRDLDILMFGKNDDSNYPASISSAELMGMSSDREDSGIHTADVSCSVSQADEPVEDTELTTPIEKLTIEEEPNTDNYVTTAQIQLEDNEDNKTATIELLEALQRDASENLEVPEPKPEPTRIYENIDLTPSIDLLAFNDVFSLLPQKMEAPKGKPPPPPPEDPEPEFRRINSTKRIKRELHIKRSSFLGLDEPTDNEIYPEVLVQQPPDINSFLQKESKLEKSLYRKVQEENMMGLLSKVESHDSGLDIDRGRLSSDTWCSSIGDSVTPSPERQDSEQTNSITSEEDEITKKEREIIEMIEKEEKSRDCDNQVILRNTQNVFLNDPPYLGSESFNNPYFPKEPYDGQDSEVLKVEHDLRQLEQEELKRQHANMMFEESRAKARLNNRRSLENICDGDYTIYQDFNLRKSMPNLQYEFIKSEAPIYQTDEYRKSTSDIQRDYHKADYPPENRKSMIDLKKTFSPLKRQPIKPGKPIRPMTKEKDRFLMMNPATSDALYLRQASRQSLQQISAVPKLKHQEWKPEKAPKQHWLIQEAELRRISDQNNASAKNWPLRQEKHLPDAVIQTLTQRVQNRGEINPPIRRSAGSPNNKDMYLDHSQTVGHALPMPYQAPIAMEDPQDRMLSVSGKKKCSNCNKELGRGAAMIIESLCLFYHMECFICCVCHVQLGDGRMGTDVRVRNQKLHCHNCYSSDDGIKFSCV